VNEAAVSTDFTAFLAEDALRGARIGVARDMMGTHEGVDKVIDDAINALRDLGAEIIYPAIGAWTPFFRGRALPLWIQARHQSLSSFSSKFADEQPGGRHCLQ
jgi:Asp-tRNA(Asn)/Glu-tRNA(Gln) amidotransferase A subunit family amidase